MSEEIKQEVIENQEPSATPDLEAIVAEKDKEIENLKKMNAGQDKKVTELFSKIDSLEKIVTEKDETKKTIEEQFSELKKQYETDRAEIQRKEKEARILSVIAEHKLDPTFDFDFLNRFETEDAIVENAKKRVEYYEKLKEDGFKERVQGSPPIKGVAVDKDLSEMSLEELNALLIEKPEKKEQIFEAVRKKSRS